MAPSIKVLNKLISDDVKNKILADASANAHTVAATKVTKPSIMKRKMISKQMQSENVKGREDKLSNLIMPLLIVERL